jgi:hypothetical protein
LLIKCTQKLYIMDVTFFFILLLTFLYKAGYSGKNSYINVINFCEI